jgi:hypothetical protein
VVVQHGWEWASSVWFVYDSMKSDVPTGEGDYLRSRKRELKKKRCCESPRVSHCALDFSIADSLDGLLLHNRYRDKNPSITRVPSRSPFLVFLDALANAKRGDLSNQRQR